MTNFHARILTIHHTLLEVGMYTDSIQVFSRYLKINFASYDLKEVARHLGATIEDHTKNSYTNREIERNVNARLIAYYYCLSHSDPVMDGLYQENAQLAVGFMQFHRSNNWYSTLIAARAMFEMESRHRPEDTSTTLRNELAVKQRYEKSIMTKPFSSEHIQQITEEADCPVCYESFALKDLVTTTCRHNYCQTCYKGYMLSVSIWKTPCCAICRADIKTVSIFA